MPVVAAALAAVEPRADRRVARQPDSKSLGSYAWMRRRVFTMRRLIFFVKIDGLDHEPASAYASR